MEIQWPLVFFTLLTGLGVCAFAFVAVTEWLGKAERTRLPGAITALVAMAAGGLVSIAHLGHPERLFNVLSNLGSSLAQELILAGLTGLAILVYTIMLRPGYPAQTRKIVAGIGLVLAVILAFALGTSYVLPARPAWNTFLLPLLYGASAAVLGIFTMYTWAVLREKEARVVMAVNKAALIAVIVEALVIIAFVVYLAVLPLPDPSRSPNRLLAGDLAAVFWGGVVLVGLLIPLGLTAWFLTARKKALSPLIAAVVGLVCVVGGAVATRAMLFVLGTSVEQFL